MGFWLLKTEPESWSWTDQIRVGVEPWNGVKNHQALAAMRSMALDDLAFFYHSGKERAIVGVVAVVRTAYPDPDSPPFVRVDVAAWATLGRPIPLAAVKAMPGLGHLALVRQPRLSVMPIDAAAWAVLLQMGQGIRVIGPVEA